MGERPLLKSYVELTEQDFAQHPIWIGVHGTDEAEPWHDECDEETFRPWDGPVPAPPQEGMLLVQASFTFADGTVASGFVTPQPLGEPPKIEIMQPQIFSGSTKHGFWEGIFRRSDENRQIFYRAFNKSERETFPIRFAARPGLTSGQSSGVIEGFYVIEKRKVKVCR